MKCEWWESLQLIIKNKWGVDVAEYLELYDLAPVV